MSFNHGSHHRRVRRSALVVASVALLVGVTACGDSEESRLRNVAVASCDSPLFAQTRNDTLVALFKEVERLKAEIEKAEAAMTRALEELERVRKNVPYPLQDALSEYNRLDDLVTSLEKKERLSFAEQLFIQIFTAQRDDWKSVKLDPLLLERATQLNKFVKDHRDKADAVVVLKAQLVETTTSVNQVTEMKSCPVILRPADAEDYTNQVATPSSVTPPPPKTYFFFDEPIPTDDSGASAAGSDSEPVSTSSSVVTETSESSTPSVSSPELAENSDDSTTSSSAVEATPSVTIPTVTIAVPVLQPPQVYKDVTPADVEENLLESLIENEQNPTPNTIPTETPTTSTIPAAELAERITDVQQQVDNVVKEIIQQVATQSPTTSSSVAPGSLPEDETLAVVSRAPAEQLPENAKQGAVPVRVDAVGYAPSTAVLILDDKGAQVAAVPVSDTGTVSAVVALSREVAARPIILAGVNGKKKAVATATSVVEEIQTSAATAGNDADSGTDDEATTDSTSEDSTPVDSTVTESVDVSGSDGESGNDSGGVVMWLLAVVLALAIAVTLVLVRLRQSRASLHRVSDEDSSDRTPPGKN